MTRPFRISRAENTSHSLFREPCTRILDHSPCPEGAHQSSSLFRYIELADEHNGMRATSYSGGVRIIQMNAEQRPMGGAGKYCMSNVLFGRGSNHFNALFGRGFGEYIVTLVNLRKGCMQQACSTPDTTFVSLPTGGRNLQPTYSVDNAFEGTRQPSTNRHWRLLLRSSPCRRSSLQYRRLLLWIRRGRSRRQRPPTTTPCLPRHRRRVRRRYIAHNIGRPSMTRS